MESLGPESRTPQGAVVQALRIVLLVLILIMVVDLMAGLFRRPIDDFYLMEVERGFRPPDCSWPTLLDASHRGNWWLWSWGGHLSTPRPAATLRHPHHPLLQPLPRSDRPPAAVWLLPPRAARPPARSVMLLVDVLAHPHGHRRSSRNTAIARASPRVRSCRSVSEGGGRGHTDRGARASDEPARRYASRCRCTQRIPISLTSISDF